MLRQIILSGFALLLSGLTMTANAADIDKTQPYTMMKQVAAQTFTRLKQDKKIIQKNPEHLKVVVEDDLMPYVNYKYTALKLLGSNLRGAKREDVLVFIKSFRHYLVSSYAQVLTQYTDQRIVFAPSPKIDDKQRITSVKVDIIDTPRPNIKLEFKLRKDKKTGEWSAFDMVAEGISLLSSKQSEWSGKIRQEGILAVAKQLEQRAQVPISFEDKK